MPARADCLVHGASAINVLVAVFSGMTVGDGPVTEMRGSRLAYCESARDTFLGGNGTDLMHGREDTDSRASNHGQAMTDQPNQDRPGKKLRSAGP